MALGLSHSLSRYKLKFSPDKVDTMIVQAIGESFHNFSLLHTSHTFTPLLSLSLSLSLSPSLLPALLDDLDKELNNYAMRLREWYGWHFPELNKIVTDNLTYARTVKALGELGLQIAMLRVVLVSMQITLFQSLALRIAMHHVR